MARGSAAGSGRRPAGGRETRRAAPEPYRLGGSAGQGPASSGWRASRPQPVRGVLLLPRRRGHERPRRAAAERVRHARRRRVDVRRRRDAGRLRGQLGGDQGHRPKTAASLGPDPSPDGGQQRAIAEAVSLAELWLDRGDHLPAGQHQRRRLEPGGVDRADDAGLAAAGRAGRRAHRRRDGGRAEPGRRGPGRRPARDGRHGADAPADAADLGREHVRPAARPGPGSAGHRGGRRDRHRAAAERAGARRPAADQRQGVRRGAGAVDRATSPCTWRCGSAPGSGCSPPRAGCGSRCWRWSSSTRAASPSTPPRWSRRSASSIRPTSPSSSSTLEGGLFEPQKTPEQTGGAGAAGDHAGAGRGLGGRGGHPGDRAADAVGGRAGRDRTPGPGHAAVRPRRPSPPWSASSCGRGGCGTRPTCGRRCGTPAASRAGMPSGRIRTWCRPRPTWTIRSASSAERGDQR